MKSEDSSVQSSPMGSFLVFISFFACVVPSLFFMCTSVTAAFSLHTLKALVHNNNNNPFTLLLHSRVCLTVLIYLPRLWCEHCEKYRSLWGWQLHSWDFKCTFSVVFIFWTFTTSCQPDLVLGKCRTGNVPSDISMPRGLWSSHFLNIHASKCSSNTLRNLAFYYEERLFHIIVFFNMTAFCLFFSVDQVVWNEWKYYRDGDCPRLIEAACPTDGLTGRGRGRGRLGGRRRCRRRGGRCEIRAVWVTDHLLVSHALAYRLET